MTQGAQYILFFPLGSGAPAGKKISVSPRGVLRILRMGKHWHTVHNHSGSDSHEITAEVTTGTDSPWYSGHFPGMPILPGIAQLSMVFDAIQESVRKRMGTLSVSEIKKVRFRQLVSPGDTLRIEALPAEHDPLTFTFKLLTRGQAACSGVMILVRDAARPDRTGNY